MPANVQAQLDRLETEDVFEHITAGQAMIQLHADPAVAVPALLAAFRADVIAEDGADVFYTERMSGVLVYFGEPAAQGLARMMSDPSKHVSLAATEALAARAGT